LIWFAVAERLQEHGEPLVAFALEAGSEVFSKGPQSVGIGWTNRARLLFGLDKLDAGAPNEISYGHTGRIEADPLAGLKRARSAVTLLVAHRHAALLER
jgi:hypothetical protein